jgi:hypothetical protein
MTTRASLTDAELVERLQLQSQHGATKAAGILGVGTSAFRTSIQQAKARGLTAQSPVLDEKDKLKLQVRQLTKQLENIHRDNDTAETIRQAIYGLSATSAVAPKWLINARGKPGVALSVPSVLASDWHYGEVIQASEVGGVNEFNAAIAAKRIKRLTETVIDLSFNHMGRAERAYPGLVVNYGGDMISGDIHEELMVSNDRTPWQGVTELVGLMSAQLTAWADAFGRVAVFCVVGNHGRGTMKPRMKGRVFTSFEWNIYTMLEREFRNDPRITFTIPGETDAYYRIYGHRYLLTHGDSLGVRGGDGIIGALGPIARGALKVGKSEAQIGREFDTVLMGHWHQYLTLPGIIVNNSLKGYDEYARLMLRAPYSRPSQALWFTHPVHGITTHWQVYLEPQRNVKNRKWVEWTQ